MKLTGTKAQFLDFHEEIQAIKRESPVMAAFNAGRIETFYRNNEAKLTAVHEKRLAIYKKYCQESEDGKSFKEETYMMEVPGEDGKMKQVPDKRVAMILPVIELSEADKAAYIEKQRKAFEKEIVEYMNQQVDWIV